MKRKWEETGELDDKKKRAEELQKKIQEKLKNIQSIKQEKIEHSSMKDTATMSKTGNLFDNEGNVLHVSHKPVATTLINKKFQEETRKNLLKIEKSKDNIKKLESYDPSLPSDQLFRKNKSFQFNEKGKYIKQGEMLREYQAKKRFQKEKKIDKIEEMNEKIEIEENLGEIYDIKQKIEESKKSLIGDVQLRIGINDIPDIEWWDQLILNNNSYKNYEINSKLVNNLYVEHPKKIKSAYKEVEIGPIALPLTLKEKKKLRTQTRLEREKEKQQKIRLGLIEPPAPKANLKNFMRVHLNDGATDPTKLEKMIVEQIEERKHNHEKRNLENKLTPEQKKEKKKKKYNEGILNLK
jgi:U4/U6 small nuclear ribonucleoprotein PRP3